MPRNLRIFCNSKIYHIILKGIDNQDIFYDNQDRYVFLENIKKSQKKYTYNVLAYCLMNNHVHMVIQVENDLLSKAIQSLTIRYVYYFNKKYDREGPFVRNRFSLTSFEDVPKFIKGYSKEEKEKIIKNIENIVGTNPRQMARVIGINRKLIYKILKKQK